MPLSPLEQKVLDFVDEQEVAGFLQGLVRAKSVFPPGDCVEAAEFCAALFARESSAGR